jgi:hypothetical protein
MPPSAEGDAMKKILHEAGCRIRIGTSLAMLVFMPLAAFAGLPLHNAAPAGDRSADVFFLNEELTYEVSWMKIPLGEVRTIVTRDQGSGEAQVVAASAYIRSYSGVPFVDLDEVDETTMDGEGIPMSFRAREKEDKKWKFTDYTFDQQKHMLFAKEHIADSESGNGGVLKKVDSVTIPQNCVDGLSLLFFARMNVRSARQAAVPTFIKGKQGTTIINFDRNATSTDIDAVDYPVDVLEIDGEAKFTGIAGMTGEFTGWFSNDSAQVPIKGKFKIFLGSITIELKQWKRPGWNPPRHASDSK